MRLTSFVSTPRSLIALSSLAALALASSAHAQIATPERPVTPPSDLESPANPDAAPVPVEDLSYTRTLGSTAWSHDSEEIFLVTSLTGRNNIWKIPAGGGWPVQLTRSDERQGGLTPSPDGAALYFTQDVGGDEQYDIYAVPTQGGVVRNLTKTPELRENNLLIAPGGKIGVVSTKLRIEGQVNLAIIDLETGETTALLTETNPVYRWSPAAWIENGQALIAVRSNANQTLSEVWRVDVATGAKTMLLGKADTIYRASDATPDGRLIAVTTNDGTGQLRAGIYDTQAKAWRTPEPTPWEQTAGNFSPDGKAMTVIRNENGRSMASLVNVESLAEMPLALPSGLNSFGGAETPFSPDGSALLVVHSGADTPT
ncbi:MAG: S9 family peptidase, partial [Pseudomonadota bacterium]